MECKDILSATKLKKEMQERQRATKFIEQGTYSERQYINRTIKIVGMQCNLNKIKEMRGANKQHNDEIRNAN